MLLEVQRAQLDRDDQHARLGLRSHDVARQLERVDRRGTAHEADHRTLDGVGQCEVADDRLIESRRHEAGAGDADHVRDAARLAIESELVERAPDEPRRLALENAHPRPRRGERARHVEAILLGSDVAAGRCGLQCGPAIVDRAALDHAAEQRVLALARETAAGEVDEDGVHVVVRHGRDDSVEEGGRHVGSAAAYQANSRILGLFRHLSKWPRCEALRPRAEYSDQPETIGRVVEPRGIEPLTS